MDKRKIMNNFLVILFSFQSSFQICFGNSPTPGVQNQESNSNQNPISKRAQFRVLEEPRLESLYFSNHQDFRQGLLENHRLPESVISESSIPSDLPQSHQKPSAATSQRIPPNGYTLTNQSPKTNAYGKLPVSGNEARFSLQNRHRGKRPKPTGEGPSRRQGVTEAPKLDITSVSPIQSSLGGLTGLQGLPPLSLIQFVKLLVAVTPFIIPMVFVPLLIFTLGMFMIPVNKTSYFIGGDAGVRNIGSSHSSSWTWGTTVGPALTNFAKKIANHEECIERLTCEIGRKYLSEQGKGAMLNRSVLQRILNYFNHPLMHRISRSLQTSPDACTTRICGPASFLEKHFFQPNMNSTV